MEAGFDSDIGGNVPDWDNTESRESDEDAAWRDLVARFDAPATTTEPAPWPERENVPSAPGWETQETDSTAEADGNSRGAGDTGETDGVLGPGGIVEADGAPGPGGIVEADGALGSDRIVGADGAPGAGGILEADGAPGADGEPGGSGILGADGTKELNEVEDAPEAHGAGDLLGADRDSGARGSGAEETRRTDADAGLAAEDVPRADADAQGTEEADGAAGRGTEGGTREARGAGGIWGPRGMRGFDDDGIRSALDPDGADEPDVIQAARRRRRTEARSIRARQAPAAATGVSDDGEHYIPPPPPPLPKLDSLAKGAWTALFGGPAYLVVATAAGWSVPGIAAFCAVAAFITGFAILVLRMNDPGPGGPDDGDDGAVV